MVECYYCIEEVPLIHLYNKGCSFCSKECMEKYNKRPVEIEEMRNKIIFLTREIEELKKRNAFLECEPYRGPEFFEALKEENNSGLLEKIE